MTRKQLATRVEHWRRRLLPEWRVLLFDEPPDWADDQGHDYFAICQTAEDYPEARLHFTDECLGRDDVHVETTIVHELLHPIMREMRSTLDHVTVHVASNTWSVIRSQLESAEERAVDRLAHAIVRLEVGEDADVGPRTTKGPIGKTTNAVDIVDHQ